ncbi:class I SAM-dependent methyltransferase [Actinomycetospora straminea]|uniref:Methyltransferase type 11 domain-containing protein n=1 Tax=Actinomycetospora straminea TaxID=663607 RepID=A0ABP9F794_9PSEU|nr:class I SAM-dependent methyltransferase [Actinomycetospora straminea]MDD7934808.1 class I SAM-dependent methyltransferase [Actinomycetospora straminea]
MRTLQVDGDELWCEAMAGLHGEVVELGCGDGRNLPHYPPTVDGVHAFEPDPSLRHEARTVAAWATTPVWVRDDPVEALPLDSDSADGAVLHLLLNRRPAPVDVISELARVLRAGAPLVILEQPDADPLSAVRAGPFTVEDTWHVDGSAGPRVVGSARRNTR